MMEIKTVNEMRIFLASSSELRDDRRAFSDFIRRLANHYKSRNYNLGLIQWEYQNSMYNDRRKQDEYNEMIRTCDIFVMLLHSKVGEFTLEEFDIISEESQKRHLPFLLYFKDLKRGKTPEAIKRLQNHISTDLGHYWGSYDNQNNLQLDFTLWLDYYLFESISRLKVENSAVMMGDETVAKLSELPFAANNAGYKQLSRERRELAKKIENLRNLTEKYPDKQVYRDDLQKTVDNYNLLTDEFERNQQALLDAAKQIAGQRQISINDQLQSAINAFDEGDLDNANAILNKLSVEAEKDINHLIKYPEQLHQVIEAFRLQALTVMANVKMPIDERINRVTEIYAKADDWASRSDYDKEKYSQLLFDYASFLYDYAYFDKAIHIYLRQIKLSEELYSTNNPNTAKSYDNIGKVYHSQGEYDQALEYLNKSLNIREKVLGPEHPDTAGSYYNIGIVYRYKGNNKEALEYHLKALHIREKVLGFEDPQTADSYNSIGIIYKNQGNDEKALEYYFKALHIREKVLGAEHPQTAKSYNNIGIIYGILGKYDMAIKYLNRSLSIKEKAFGLYHPSTARTYNNIGMVYHNQGEYDKALEFLNKSLNIREKVLGPNHPDTAWSYKYIDRVHESLDDLSNNPLSLASTYSDKGSVFVSQGKNDEALKHYRKALKIRKKELNKDHPLIATSYSDIGSVYVNLKDYYKAIKYLREALKIRIKVDKMSPITGAALYTLGMAYLNQGHYKKSLEYFHKALTISEKNHGDNHPYTQTIRESIEYTQRRIHTEWQTVPPKNTLWEKIKAAVIKLNNLPKEIIPSPLSILHQHYYNSRISKRQ